MHALLSLRITQVIFGIIIIGLAGSLLMSVTDVSSSSSSLKSRSEPGRAGDVESSVLSALSHGVQAFWFGIFGVFAYRFRNKAMKIISMILDGFGLIGAITAGVYLSSQLNKFETKSSTPGAGALVLSASDPRAQGGVTAAFCFLSALLFAISMVLTKKRKLDDNTNKANETHPVSETA